MEVKLDIMKQLTKMKKECALSVEDEYHFI